MNQPESIQSLSEQLRKFINLGPQSADPTAANEAERLVKQISARAPPKSDAAQLALELTAELRGWFTEKAPGSSEGVARMRGELAAKLAALRRAVSP
jgi:hypothetical protein